MVRAVRRPGRGGAVCDNPGMEGLAPIVSLGIALAIGLLVGLERGWKERERAEGRRVAGIRTFALIGLLGGIWGLLAEALGHLLLAVAFAALAVVLVWSHAISQRQQPDVGITGVIAGLLTFALGAMVTLGYVAPAAMAAVVTTVLLGLKPALHTWVRHLEEKELYATFKLLLISVVVLPLLPNEGYGPWQALNPYRIWWMVVLIAAISFVGYFAMKVAGTRKGIMVTGLFAGLASSTAVTVHLARLAHAGQGPVAVIAAGLLAAWATMFPRMLVVTAVLSPSLAVLLLWPVVAMTCVAYAGAWWFWRRSEPQSAAERTRMRNPFELGPALFFAALLAAIMVLSRALREHFGDAGLYLLAAVSGLADVDAITLSIADMTRADLPVPVAALAVLIAAFVNTLVKAGLAFGIGGVRLAGHLVPPALLVIGSGLVAWWLTA